MGPPSPTGDSDGPEEAGVALWKRRYLALQETALLPTNTS